MTGKESELVDVFLDLAKKNGYCAMVCFTIGAFAFDKGTDEQETVKRLKALIALANKYPQEDDFVAEFEKRYINQ